MNVTRLGDMRIHDDSCIETAMVDTGEQQLGKDIPARYSATMVQEALWEEISP